MSQHALSTDAIRILLEREGLDPAGVDLEWIARIKHDTEQRIGEHKDAAEFAAATATLSAVPPSD